MPLTSNDKPFSPSSVWNTKISPNATYQADTKIAPLTVGLSSWLPDNSSSVPVLQATSTSPVEKILYNPDTWWNVSQGTWKQSGNTAAVESSILAGSSNSFPYTYHPYVSQSATSLVLPSSYDPITNPSGGAAKTAQVPAGAYASKNPDGHMTVFQPDGKVLETFGTIILSDGTVVAQTYKITDSAGQGDGWQNGITASMIPVYAGVIQQEEVQAGSINHAMKIVVPAGLLKTAFEGPALTFDRGATTESPPYSGDLPMGSQLAIPQNVDLASLGLTTSLGQMIGKAAQDYGFIITDRGGSGITPIVEGGATLSSLDNWSSGTDADLQKIFDYVQHVTSNPPISATVFTLPESGTDNNWIYGTSANNTISGTSANDWIDGGTGADTMSGGTGDDHYTIDNTSDVIVENSGAGIDTAYSYVNWTLPANVENGIALGDWSHTLNGNSANNRLTGSADWGSGAVDTLDGKGGNDILIAGDNTATMTGGTGNDIFQFNAGSYANTVTDFTHGADVVDLRDMMTSVSSSLKTDPFASGVLELKNVTGGVNVVFDADGTAGAGAEVAIVFLSGVTAGTTVINSDLAWA